MRRVAYPLTAVLVCLVILIPFVWASTAESWTDGIADYEPDDIVQIVAHDHVAVVHSEPVFSFHSALIVVGRLVLPDRTPALEVVPSSSHTRAPPLS